MLFPRSSYTISKSSSHQNTFEKVSNNLTSWHVILFLLEAEATKCVRWNIYPVAVKYYQGMFLLAHRRDFLQSCGCSCTLRQKKGFKWNILRHWMTSVEIDWVRCLLWRLQYLLLNESFVCRWGRTIFSFKSIQFRQQYIERQLATGNW